MDRESFLDGPLAAGFLMPRYWHLLLGPWEDGGLSEALLASELRKDSRSLVSLYPYYPVDDPILGAGMRRCGRRSTLQVAAMAHPFRFRSWLGAGLGLLILFTTGCAGSVYGWTVRTSSTALAPSSGPVNHGRETVAVLTPLSSSLRGNEAGLGQYLGDVIRQVAPTWTVIDERQALNLINKHGLSGEYAQMRSDAEQSHILNRTVLQKIGEVLGARYVFQPRLAYFSQTMTDRWSLAFIDVLISQTRSALMRLSLQLWDAKSGELIWSSMAETSLQSEAVSKDPVFMEDIARVTFGGMVADLQNRRTASKYTPLNRALDRLIPEAIAEERNGKESETLPDQGGNGGQGK